MMDDEELIKTVEAQAKLILSYMQALNKGSKGIYRFADDCEKSGAIISSTAKKFKSYK